MKFTNAPPRDAGWYWAIEARDESPRPVFVNRAIEVPTGGEEGRSCDLYLWGSRLEIPAVELAGYGPEVGFR